MAPIFPTVRGEIDLKNVLGVRAYSSVPELPCPLEVTKLVHDHKQGEPEHDHSFHIQQRNISCVQVSCPVLTSEILERLDRWIQSVLWENRLPLPDPVSATDLQVLRCKGIFATTDGKMYMLQGVRNLYEITEIGDKSEGVGVVPKWKLAFIGKGLGDHVKGSLEALLSSTE
jgi:G3E family GTPase